MRRVREERERQAVLLFELDVRLGAVGADTEDESDSLDARVAKETGLAARTVRDLRMDLRNEGLVKSQPEKDETGAVTRWLVYRTQARREPES